MTKKKKKKKIRNIYLFKAKNLTYSVYRNWFLNILKKSEYIVGNIIKNYKINSNVLLALSVIRHFRFDLCIFYFWIFIVIILQS